MVSLAKAQSRFKKYRILVLIGLGFYCFKESPSNFTLKGKLSATFFYRKGERKALPGQMEEADMWLYGYTLHGLYLINRHMTKYLLCPNFWFMLNLHYSFQIVLLLNFNTPASLLFYWSKKLQKIAICIIKVYQGMQHWKVLAIVKKKILPSLNYGKIGSTRS